MSNSRLAIVDAKIAAKFKSIGEADAAMFTSCGVAVPDCTIYVNRGVQLIGDQSQVIDNQITVTAQLAQTGKTPVRADTFTVGADVFIVDSISSSDESSVVCIVTLKDCCA